MAELRIEQWWILLDTTHKEWFRENLRAQNVDPRRRARCGRLAGLI